MAHDQALIAAGCGCRRGCDVHDLLQALDRALQDSGRMRSELAALCAPDFKRDEPGLVRAAELLALPLWFLPQLELQAQTAGTLSWSAHAQVRAGVPSVAESAALAGARRLAGPRVKLLGPRQIAGGATCALASTDTKKGALT